MTNENYLRNFIVLICAAIFAVSSVSAQSKTGSADKLVRQTKYKTDSLKFGAGGTISVVGAQEGSIDIEGWEKNEVEIRAEIEVQAANEEDAARLANVCGFFVEKSTLNVRIFSVGTTDKKTLKKIDKNFPKKLRGMPCRVDYRIKVPSFSDLEIDGGRGDFNLRAVEGTMRLKYLESNAKFFLIGGTVQASIGSGSVDVSIGTRSWRGRFAEIQLVKGDMKVYLPNNLNADLEAKILRTGEIDNDYEDLAPSDESVKFTATSLLARAGAGGAKLSFTIGDGNLQVKKLEKPAP